MSTTVALHVGIVGAGLIGQSWAALCLARGHRVTLCDPRPAAPAETADFVARAWPHLEASGLIRGHQAAPGAAQFVQDVAEMGTVDYVQENGPDRIDAKRDIIAALERVVDARVVIASSTSSLMASDIAAGARHPGRILVAHPMNPPHLVPMVELVAGRATTPDTVDRAEAFYRDLERVPIRVKKEVPGHLANRLTAALYREAVHIAAEGIADVAAIDQAISAGPGMRWALMGPHLIYHLGGGAGGYRHYLEHLGPTQEARWRELGHPVLTEAVKTMLIEGVEAEIGSQDTDDLVRRRDAALVAMARLKADNGF
ncbi:MAG: 3-hydroxyacyl-CoA dehydrogenase NAD-binding domain-containing protein [Rhodobacteraceae bacterium]|nr:3-hydroxyacyl-CoA dehydrogenase NAD-binding domain-containing protein [Paracoccaceae bacterium]